MPGITPMWAHTGRIALIVLATLALAFVVFDWGGAPSASTVVVDPSESDVVIDLVYSEGYVTGVDPVVEVSKGDTVTISVVSDTADQLHVHGGYDLFFSVPRAQDVSFSFVADRLGVFPVELESLRYVLFELDVG